MKCLLLSVLFGTMSSVPYFSVWTFVDLSTSPRQADNSQLVNLKTLNIDVGDRLGQIWAEITMKVISKIFSKNSRMDTHCQREHEATDDTSASRSH